MRKGPKGLRAKTITEYTEAKAIYEEYQRLKRRIGISRRDIAYFLRGRHWEEAAKDIHALAGASRRRGYVV